jgi:RNA polymerase sigma-70 factor (ECF subfamily)
MTGTADSTSDSLETDRLLDQASQGDERAFQQLFEQFRPRLKEFIALRLDRQLRPRIDASDILQETQIEVHRRLKSFVSRRPMPFHVWLHKTAYERLVMTRRQHLGALKRQAGRDVPLPERSSLVLARKLLLSGLTPSEQASRQELARRVHVALAELSESDREILLMRVVDGLAFDEIAGILDVESTTARKRHGRAILRLHQALGGEF